MGVDTGEHVHLGLGAGRALSLYLFLPFSKKENIGWDGESVVRVFVVQVQESGFRASEST